MKKNITIAILLFLVVIFPAQNSFACPPGLTCGPADVYEVTVTRIELCTGTTGTDCQGATVIGSGAMTMDIAGAASGAQVAAYGTVENLQVGHNLYSRAHHPLYQL